MNDMKTTTRSAVPSDNGLMLPRLASVQAIATPVDKSAGGGCSNNLIQRRPNSSRAGVHDRGLLL